MSIRDQERRQREAERSINEAMRRADREVGKRIEARAHEATLRAREVVRRIEKGDVQPRPLPGLREDSMESMESMGSMQSAASIKSMQSGDYVSGLSDEAEKEGNAGGNMMKDMPAQESMPYDPQSAEEDLAQRVTEETGSGGDPHLHNERKADEIAKQITEDTGTEGDMTLHAERKVEQMGSEMFQD